MRLAAPVTALSKLMAVFGIAIRLPLDMLARLQQPDEARAAVYAVILFDMNSKLHDAAITALASVENPRIGAMTKKWLQDVAKLKREDRLPLLNLVIQSLVLTPQPEREKFVSNVEKLVRSDRRFTLFEFVLCTMLRIELTKKKLPVVDAAQFTRTSIAEDVRLVLSVLARVGSENDAKAQETFSLIMKKFTDQGLAIAGAQECNADKLLAALEKLRLAPLVLRDVIMKTFTDCIIIDRKITPVEAELLAAIAVSLGTAVPSLAGAQFTRTPVKKQP